VHEPTFKYYLEELRASKGLRVDVVSILHITVI